MSVRRSILVREIWIVEDEPDIANLVAHHVRRERFQTEVFHDGESFLESVRGEVPDLVILDLMLPGINGLDICKILRGDERTKAVPIIMLTAKDTETDIVLGLELGADDYVVKPFSVSELMARINAVLRRTEQSEDTGTDNLITVDGLSLDLESFDVEVDGASVELTFAEFRILSLLIARPGRVFTRRQIIDGIWDDYRVVTSKTVDVHVTHLRKKLGKYGSYVKTVRGVGYKFEA
jgi:two-component system alkaline phosphatase synthesis response regulator PhoP